MQCNDNTIRWTHDFNCKEMDAVPSYNPLNDVVLTRLGTLYRLEYDSLTICHLTYSDTMLGRPRRRRPTNQTPIFRKGANFCPTWPVRQR